ncbi:MAG: cysteine desulfurase [SAR324 cluster bacterium]|uniref:cysteine desulfurase n=1 Tax=SAR324 cluster bacterium TaxID=2024889 RepID=A0A7X9FQ00_9DELT|nr:cysteine desulfurase [SAR324 cluster bacterium]
MENGIYLDNNATTPCDPRVVEKMLPYFSEVYGNPANGYHIQGRMAGKAVDKAREQVAELIGAQPYEIYFTGGASESDNLAIFGIIRNPKHDSQKRIVSSKIEHKAILKPCRKLEEEGYYISLLPVDSQGVIKVENARNEINSQTILVSIQLANNEIGSIQPVKEIAEIAHEFGATIHSDAAQAVGKIPVNVEALGIDMLSISAHKFYGPKGIGALYIKGGLKNIPIEPIIYGGGQEKGLRSGTTNVPAIVGFGEAAEICKNELSVEIERISGLRNLLEKELTSRISDIVINAQKTERLPNTSSIIFPGIEADALILTLVNVMMGTGSACNSGAIEPSHVLQAMGISREAASRTVRASLGRFTTKEQIIQTLSEITASINRVAIKKTI